MSPQAETTFIEETKQGSELADDDDAGSFQNGPHKEALIQLRPLQVCLGLLPLLAVYACCLYLQLPQISRPVAVGGARSLVQLLIVGSLLVPVFHAGTEHPEVVLLYIIAMTLVASTEAAKRCQKSSEGLLDYAEFKVDPNLSGNGAHDHAAPETVVEIRSAPPVKVAEGSDTRVLEKKAEQPGGLRESQEHQHARVAEIEVSFSPTTTSLEMRTSGTRTSSLEASIRKTTSQLSFLRLPGSRLSRHLFLAMLSAITIVASFAFLVVLQPSPFWDPRYTIPITGMLLGNATSALSLSTDLFLKSVGEKRTSVLETWLAFGAHPSEAAVDLMREAIRVGLTPTLNTMAVLGVVTIPGMMTGQILGGSSPLEAGLYQGLIMYLICATSFVAVGVSLVLCLRDVFVKTQGGGYVRRRSATAAMSSLHQEVDGAAKSEESGAAKSGRGTSTLQTPLLTTVVPELSGEEVSHTVKPRLAIFESRKLLQHHDPPHRYEVIVLSTTLLPVQQFNERAVELDISNELGQDLKFYRGRLYLVDGPSGAGKTTFLRSLALLDPINSFIGSQLRNCGCEVVDEQELTKQDTYVDSSTTSPPSWRSLVRFISQSRVGLEGSVGSFIDRLEMLKERRAGTGSSSIAVVKLNASPSINDDAFKAELATLLCDWGLCKSSEEVPDFLDRREWKSLSEGESQRVYVAIALASRPLVLLLDEPTSALDDKTKRVVERTLKEYVRTGKIATILLTSHDEGQKQRLLLGGGDGDRQDCLSM
ncbi:unnamed protein product [Amoebophrya sp. A25]|nr:unnamed protein product [Amoebophrya sp. A25]|eukprot:GSA25T00022786001.1